MNIEGVQAKCCGLWENWAAQSLELHEQVAVAGGDGELFIGIVRRAAKTVIPKVCDDASDSVSLGGVDTGCSSNFFVGWHEAARQWC